MKKFSALILAATLCLPSSAYAYTANRSDQNGQQQSERQDRGQQNTDRQSGNRQTSDRRDDRSNSNTRSNDNNRSTTVTRTTTTTRTSTNNQSRHTFVRGSRFSRAGAPNYRRVSYRESSRLSAPPRGYVWVRAGHDALLVRLSNNIVIQIVVDVF